MPSPSWSERRQGGAARRIKDGRRRQSSDRGVSVQGRWPERLCLHLHQPANPEHWTRLLKVMGREDLIGDQRYARPDARTERREEVDAIVSEWTMRHDKHTAMDLVSRATIPAGAVLDTAELAADKTFAGARHPPDHETSGGRRLCHERLAGSFRRPDPGPSAPRRFSGQHGEEVLAEWLKMDRDQIGCAAERRDGRADDRISSALSRTRAGCASSRSIGPRC